jgi:hypothetical protein
MCLGCWEEEGRPYKVTDAVRKLAPKFQAADGWGPLHVVVEDWNLDDNNLECCRSCITSVDLETYKDEIALIEAMQAMTWEERWATAILAEDPEFNPEFPCR